jgi:hypothetical protein
VTSTVESGPGTLRQAIENAMSEDAEPATGDVENAINHYEMTADGEAMTLWIERQVMRPAKRLRGQQRPARSPE